jgi:signal transduction histidine kinase
MTDSSRPFIQIMHTQESVEFALESVRMGTWDVDLSTDKIMCSLEMLKMWGIHPEDFHGERFLLQGKVHSEDLIKMIQEIEEAIEKDSIYDLEYRIHPTPGETKWIKSRGRCTFYPGSKVPSRFSGIVYDITDKKLKQEALDRAVRARDNFFMIAGHELRTPLTCLELQLQVMEYDLKDNLSADKIEHGLKKQREHLSRITRIIENILDESRINRGEIPMVLEEFDLSEMVQRIVSEFKIAAEASGVSVTVETEPSVIGKWDRFRIEQVLLNLLSNALRYGEKKPIHIQLMKSENKAQLSVKDSGCGIKAEDQNRIFERFERAADSDTNGLGLGLYISSNVVKAHGGEIKLTSEPEKGSTFTIFLPLN